MSPNYHNHKTAEVNIVITWEHLTFLHRRKVEKKNKAWALKIEKRNNNLKILIETKATFERGTNVIDAVKITVRKISGQDFKN